MGPAAHGEPRRSRTWGASRGAAGESARASRRARHEALDDAESCGTVRAMPNEGTIFAALESADHQEAADLIELLASALTTIAETSTDVEARSVANEALAIFHGR